MTCPELVEGLNESIPLIFDISIPSVTLTSVNSFAKTFTTRKTWLIIAEIALILTTVGLLLATWLPIDSVHNFIFKLFGVK